MSALPFVAVVGQERAKQALLLAAAEPRLGGVLLRGDKGSAKTTLARGLAALLPGDAPFVELPLGAAEDRVLGSIDLGELLTSDTPRFRPGLLAAAHGGVLYVDEINLLADHLVDALLDVAVSGVNRVERDGISHHHPARFVLVASMNPEEGELRPQLLDRFGLSVEVRAPADIDLRTEAVRRQLAIDAEESTATYASATAELYERVEQARRRAVHPEPEVLTAASSVAVGVGAEGLRADLMLVRGACANAALAGRSVAGVDDLRGVAELVLGHRRRRRPFEQPGIDPDELDDALDRAIGRRAGEPTPAGERPPPEGGDRSASPGSNDASPAPDSPSPPGAPPGGQRPARHDGVAGERFDAADPRPPRGLAIPLATGTGHPGRTGRGPLGTGPRGRSIRTTTTIKDGIDPLASAVALATRRAIDGAPGAGAVPDDLRGSERQRASGALVVFVVDASGSMGAERRMATSKAAVIELLGDAYRRRCRVALIAFRADEATTVLRPTSSVEIARSRLAELRTGGTSPIAAGLGEAQRLIAGSARGEPATVVLVTDGRASSKGTEPQRAIAAAISAAGALVRTGTGLLVVDSETGPPRLGLARQLASEAGATYVTLDEPSELPRYPSISPLR